MAEPTAPSALRTPLLRTLAALAGNKAGVPVKCEDVVSKVLDEAGVTDPDTRKKGGSNANWMATQVLRKKEGLLGADDKRGWWSLTETGLAAALGDEPPAAASPPAAPAAETTVDDILASADEPDAPVVVPPPAPPKVVSAWEDDEVGVPLYPSVRVDTYTDDSYIKSLAIGATPCFGGFDPASSVCGGCPVAGSCQSSQAMRLAKIAASLRKAEEEERARAAKAATTAARVSDSTRATPTQTEDIEDILDVLESKKPATPPIPPPGSGVEIAAMVESKCYVCGATVPKGMVVIHTQGRGLRHKTCQ